MSYGNDGGDGGQPTAVSFSGIQESCSIGSVVEVVVNNVQGVPLTGGVEVWAAAPNGVRHECQVVERASTFIASFTPNEIGAWHIGILFNGEHIRGSPFPCYIYDVNAVRVYGLDVGLVGQELRFTVDASAAGRGTLSVCVLRGDQQIDSVVEPSGDGVYSVRFTPDGAAQYRIHITFNESDVTGSPFVLDIADAGAVSVHGDNLRSAAVGKLAHFFVHGAVGAESRDIAVVVTGPSNKEKHARIVPLDLSTYKVEFKPIEAGEHRIDVSLFNQPIYGSPFVCNVGDPDLVTVRKIPTHIDAKNLNTSLSFEIDATAAGSGNLEIIINGGRIACRVWEVAPRQFRASFTPTQPLKHTVEMRFNGEHVLHSPWHLLFRHHSGSGASSPLGISASPTAVADNSGRRSRSPPIRHQQQLLGAAAGGEQQQHYSELIGIGLRRAAVGQVAFFDIKSDSLRIENILIRLFDCDGRELNVKIIEKLDSLRCEYKIFKVGEYRLEIYINGRLIDSGALFIAGYDPEKVFVRPKAADDGQTPRRYVVDEPVVFVVDATEAGKGQLEITVNQGQVPNNVQMQDAGRCLVTFIPQHAGTYIIDVTFNGQQVHGCPIKVDVQNKHVGQPVSAPVYSSSGPPIASSSSLPSQYDAGGGRAPSLERGASSSAYFSAGASPRVDTTPSSYAPTPSPYGGSGGAPPLPQNSPRSPPLVAQVQQFEHSSGASATAAAAEDALRSPRLVQSVGSQHAPPPPPQKPPPPHSDVGYTVAQYGSGVVSPQPHTVMAHRYFGQTAESQDASSAVRPSNITQLEMTRSTELTLNRSGGAAPVTPAVAPQSPEDVRKALDSGRTYKRFESVADGAGGAPIGDQRGTSGFTSPPHRSETVPKTRYHEMPYSPMETQVPLAASRPQQHAHHQQQQQQHHHHPLPLSDSREFTHIVEPYSSDIEAMTPGTRRRLLEHSVYKAPDLKETDEPQSTGPSPGGPVSPYPADDAASESGASKHSSKATTPRLGLKFGSSKSGGSGAGVGGVAKPFDFGKSKITSKNEVVRRGKDVDVKIESLKLGKEDQLKVIVMAPTRKQSPPQEGAAAAPPELPFKMKKSRNTYEISFRPTEVGTHKVLVFVNNQFPHPQTPFPIRVYDAAQIVVGEIVRESLINDTVEFTVDAGRAGFGNLEMAIKDSDQCIIPSHVSQLEAGTAKFLVTFNPTTLGTHTVNITFNKEPISGSPFEVNIVDLGENMPDAVSRRSGAGGGMTTGSIGDTSTLESKKKDKTKKKKDKSGGGSNGLKHRDSSSRKASSAAASTTGAVSAGKTTAAASPSAFVSSFAPPPPPQQPVVTKIPSLSRVGRPAELLLAVPPRYATAAQIEAKVLDPEKQVVPAKILDTTDDSEADGGTAAQPNASSGDGTAKRIQFIPLKVGDHEIDVRVAGAEVNGNPFTCRAYDPTRILVSNVPDGVVNKAVHFTVDASAAGVGNLEVAVNDGRIPSMAHALGQHKYDISFVPRERVDHFVSIRFNNEPVPGSPFHCRIVASPLRFSAAGPGLERIPIGQPVEFWVNVPESAISGSMSPPTALAKSCAPPDVQIVDPRGETLPVRVTADPHEPNRFMCIYTPKNVGNHQVEVRYDGEPIVGSPFVSKAFDANSARLTLAGGGAEVGRPCTFTIDAAKAGAGNMEIIVSVGKRNVPNFVTAEGQAKFKVSFTPQEPNDHVISVKFNGIPIPGSPMRCPVAGNATASPPRGGGTDVRHSDVEMEGTSSHAGADEDELRLVDDLAAAQVGRPKRFSIDVAGSGTAATDECNVIVTGADGGRVPVTVRRVAAGGGGGFDVEFTPPKAGNFLIDIQLNGRSLAICPILCRAVVDAQRSGRTATDELRIFDAEDDRRGYEDDAAASVTNASERERHSNDPPVARRDEVRIRQFVRRALVDYLTQFQLELLTGVEKGLAVHVEDSRGNRIPVAVQRVGGRDARRRDAAGRDRQRFVGEWSPTVVGRHQVHVHLDGEPLEPAALVDADTVFAAAATDDNDDASRAKKGGSSADRLLYVDVLDLSAVAVVGLRESTRCGEPCEFKVDWHGSGGAAVKLAARHESGERLQCTMRKVRRGVARCAFVPRLVGLHLLDVFVDGLRLPECPYECRSVANDEPVRVHGAALRGAQRALTARFEITVAPDARCGELDVVVSDPSNSPLPVRCFKQHDSSYLVEFTPEKCGAHKIEITFGDVPVTGSPFRCEVVDPRRVVVRGVNEPLTLRNVASLIVERRDAGTGPLVVELTDPSGRQLKLDHLRTANGDDTYTFLPATLGEYALSVRLAGFPVPAAPKSLHIEEPSAPCLRGSALERDGAVQCGERAIFYFDSRRAGGAGAAAGGLKIDVRDASGQKVRHNADKLMDGTTEITFRPSTVGVHRVAVEFNNKPLADSPFKVAVVDATKMRVSSAHFDEQVATLHLNCNTASVIDVDASAAGPGVLSVEVRDHTGDVVPAADPSSTIVARTQDLGYGKHQIVVEPRRAGHYKLYLYWSGFVVPSAYPIPIVADANVGGFGATKSTTKTTTTTAMLSPSRQRKHHEKTREENVSESAAAVHSHHPQANGSSKAELPIPPPPAALSAPHSVQLYGDGLSLAVLKERAEFIVDCSEAVGGDGDATPIAASRLSVTLCGDRADIPVRVVTLRPNIFKCTYTALVAGKYELSLLLDGQHLPGSPATVEARGYATAAELIEVDTKTLKMGIIGEDVKTVIDARKAGAGNLSAQCVGPNQQPVYCELLDNRDGTYVLRVTPKELGRHVLSVRYADEHVAGSPFTFNVSNPPDPTQVRVYGPGIEHGILHSYKSNFVVETKGAGAGQLTVRVRGPKGAFNVEMQRDRQHDRTIHCKYEPREPGDYQVEVKWHGQHVPGSPFFVIIVDTEEELKRFLAGAPPSAAPQTPFVPPGWGGVIGQPPPPSSFLRGGPPPPHHFIPHPHYRAPIPPPLLAAAGIPPPPPPGMLYGIGGGGGSRSASRNQHY